MLNKPAYGKRLQQPTKMS